MNKSADFHMFKIFYLFIWLSCSMWALVPGPEIEPGPPVLGAWSLSHWTTREVPVVKFKLTNHF